MASTSGIRIRGRDKIFLIDYPAYQISSSYNLRTLELNVRDSATTTVAEVFVFWTKAQNKRKMSLERKFISI